MSKKDLLAGWTRVKFGEVAKQITDSVDPETSELERYVAGGHMDTDDLKIRRWGTVGDGYLGPAFHRKFQKGHILYGSRRTYLRKVAVADFDGICANTTFVIEARPQKIHPPLLPFIMQSEPFVEHSIKNSKGSTNPYINWKDIAKYEFALPPLDEQRRIAEILAAAENSIERFKILLGKFLSFKQVLINNLFPRPQKAPENANVLCIADICEMQEGRVFPSNDYQDTGVKLLRPGNLGEDGYLDWRVDVTRYLPDSYLKKYPDYLVRPGDIVINLTAQSLDDGFMGRVCKAGNEDDFCLLNQRLGRFICQPEILPDYLYRYLQTSYFRSRADTYCEGSKIKHLYWRHLKDFQVVLPDRNIQRNLVEKIELIDQQISNLKTHFDQTSRLKSRLLEQLLSS